MFSQAAQRETPLRSPSYLFFNSSRVFFLLFFRLSFVRRVLVFAERSEATCIYTSTRLTVNHIFSELLKSYEDTKNLMFFENLGKDKSHIDFTLYSFSVI